ncbi:UDP-N-acetylmuramoylalanine--D-glutamate ligase [Naumannella cuiyingiana]|uniref:UDP-N-acetylmuramoylalanine--D-glutamate ligase n=1 Tax=Naumannella cuiyingiana TaxID=1347891 RepID=A0A7Z0IM16_9ACTN|nr:UDP-N-acetylmuramoylalanine--D-glutamate ligase [Naumannella cuiyingiana]
MSRDHPDVAAWRGRDAPWASARVTVAGIGRSGFAAADALLELGATVTVLDERDDADNRERGTLLEVLGASVRIGPGASAALPAGTDLLIVSPGWRPGAALPVAAARAGVPVWGETELAWRLSEVPWLAITGTNGKTTATLMLAAMLRAGGLRTAAVGNLERPITETVLDPEPLDVLAVELSSFQLHWTTTMAVHSAAVLNLQPDHLDWHGGADAYAADKARIYAGVTDACVYNVADRATERMVEEAEVTEGARAIGFTLGVPAPSMVGVVDDLLVDRAFIRERRSSAVELASVSDVSPSGPHNVADALAAAALARSFGVAPRAVRDGLRAHAAPPHRLATVAELDGVRWIDDSKATNPHAVDAALSAFDRVVWIAGGQAKGAPFDDLVARHANRLRGAVLLGVDRAVIAEALARHAPELPVIEVARADSGAMAQAVAAARTLAQPGDVVALSPGCASLDIWPDYAARGDDFAAAVLGTDPPAQTRPGAKE